MPRSKLEMYVDILKVLRQKRPLKLTEIMYKSDVSFTIPKEHLDFLIKQGLIEDHPIGEVRVGFAITQKGIAMLKYLHELKQERPIVEEDRKQATISHNNVLE